MPAKGQHLSEEAKRKIRNKRKLQKSFLIGKYGITEESHREAMEKGFSWCRDCKKFLHPDLFYGKDPRCIECVKGHVQRWRDRRTYKRRESDNQYLKNWREENKKTVRRNWLKRYGVTPEWYEKKFDEQNGKCAICGTTDARRRGFFCIDHRHNDGKVRGLLCIRCNAFVSGFDDGLVDSTLQYLAKHDSAHAGQIEAMLHNWRTSGLKSLRIK